jgi:K+-transporting ATPase A subunit
LLDEIANFENKRTLESITYLVRTKNMSTLSCKYFGKNFHQNQLCQICLAGIKALGIIWVWVRCEHPNNPSASTYTLKLGCQREEKECGFGKSEAQVWKIPVVGSQ